MSSLVICNRFSAPSSHNTRPSNSVNLSETDNKTLSNGRKRVLLSVIEKVNMVFLIFLVCYLSWTVPASFGLFDHPNSNSPVHNSSNIRTNLSRSNNSGISSELSNSTDTIIQKLVNFNIASSKSAFPVAQHSATWKKNSKRKRKGPKRRHNSRKKKNRLRKYKRKFSKKRKAGKRRRQKHRKHKKTKSRKLYKLEPITIRQIIERVAQEALTQTHGSRDYSDLTSGYLPVKHNSAVDNFPAKDDTKWSSWGSCTVTCGMGQRERSRACGPACREMETMACYKRSCLRRKKNFFAWEHENVIPDTALKPKDYINPEKDACGKWMKCNKAKVESYLNNSILPSCPCLYPLHLGYNPSVWDPGEKIHYGWTDVDRQQEALYAYKPGADFCIRSKLFKGVQTLASQMCCYDNNFKLITRGKGAGTPNLISPEISPELHHKLDINPWIICKGDWTRYNQILPPNNGRQCQQNPSENIILQQTIDSRNF